MIKTNVAWCSSLTVDVTSVKLQGKINKATLQRRSGVVCMLDNPWKYFTGRRRKNKARGARLEIVCCTVGTDICIFGFRCKLKTE